MMTPFLAAALAWAATQVTLPMYESERFGVDVDLDIYYSAVATYVGIGQARPDFGEAEEKEIYRYLGRNLFKPHAFLLEASTYPMPLTGVALKKYETGFYEGADLDPEPRTEKNMIQALTAGFEEPYAFSLFFGNMATFKVPGSDVQGFSYAGYLTSFGTHHIKNNVIIDSNWFEFEAKLKGDDIKTYRKLKWSYRVGARLFGSNEITDYVYVSTLRDRIDFARTGWSLLRNSFLEASLWMKTRPHLETADVIRAFLVVGKNYPFWRNKLTFSLGVGMIVAGSDKYQGCLQVATQTMIDDIRDCRTFADPSDYFEFVPDRKPRTEFQPVIRPNLKF